MLVKRSSPVVCSAIYLPGGRSVSPFARPSMAVHKKKGWAELAKNYTNSERLVFRVGTNRSPFLQPVADVAQYCKEGG